MKSKKKRLTKTYMHKIYRIVYCTIVYKKLVRTVSYDIKLRLNGWLWSTGRHMNVLDEYWPGNRAHTWNALSSGKGVCRQIRVIYRSSSERPLTCYCANGGMSPKFAITFNHLFRRPKVTGHIHEHGQKISVNARLHSTQM